MANPSDNQPRPRQTERHFFEERADGIQPGRMFAVQNIMGSYRVRDADGKLLGAFATQRAAVAFGMKLFKKEGAG